MKRLFYLSYDLNSLSIHSLEIIRNLIDGGIEVHLLCPEGFPLPRSLHSRCRLQRVRPGAGPSAFRDVRLQVALAQHLLRAARTGRRPDLIYARQTYSSLLPCLLAHRLHIPYFAEVNGIVPLRNSVSRGRSQWLKTILEKRALGLTDAIIVPSDFLKQRLARRYRIPPARIAVVPNGANEALFRPDSQNAYQPQAETRTFTVGFIGSMGAWQGIEVLKAAIRQVASRDRGVRFDLVGDYTPDGDQRKMADTGGEARTSWNRFIDRHGLSEQVYCHGFVEYEQSAVYMRRCDVLLAPYAGSYREFGGGSPMKLYAYLATGKPVIVSDLGELTDVPALRRQQAAYFIPPDDPAALAAAILSLKQDPETRRRLGENGRAFVLASRRWWHSALRIRDIYDQQYGVHQRVAALSQGAPAGHIPG